MITLDPAIGLLMGYLERPAHLRRLMMTALFVSDVVLWVVVLALLVVGLALTRQLGWA